MTLDALILAGGLATRLKDVVDDIPKALLDVNGYPFITYQFDQLLQAGVGRVIICTGHLSEQFPEVLGHKYKDLEIIYSKEASPLGTGGAIAQASKLIASQNCLIMNGDSYINTHLDKFIDWHNDSGYEGSILTTTAKKENRYGNITVSDGKIKSFSEKGGDSSEKSYISTGHYIFSIRLIHSIPSNRVVSLEHDCFPFWVKDGLGGFYRRAKFIDIGTPESLIESKEFFRSKK